MPVSQARAGSGLQEISGKPGHKQGEGSKRETFTGLLEAVAAATATARPADPHGKAADPASHTAAQDRLVAAGPDAPREAAAAGPAVARPTTAATFVSDAAQPARPLTGVASKREPHRATNPPTVAVPSEPESLAPSEGRPTTAANQAAPGAIDARIRPTRHSAVTAPALATVGDATESHVVSHLSAVRPRVEATTPLGASGATQRRNAAHSIHAETPRSADPAPQVAPASPAEATQSGHASGITGQASLVIPPTALQALVTPPQPSGAATHLPSDVQAAVGSQVAAALSGRLSTEGAGTRTTFELRVFPENLGQIVVRISTSGGALSVHLSGTSAALGQLLHASHHEIAASLQAGGPADVNIEFGLFGGEAQPGGGQPPPSAPSSLPLNPARPGATGLRAPTTGTPGARHRLDLLA